MELPPTNNVGGNPNVCSAVSYFSTLLGSIIGAGRLSFRVRDGTGRFPAAMAAVTLFTLFWAPHAGWGNLCVLVVECVNPLWGSCVRCGVVAGVTFDGASVFFTHWLFSTCGGCV